MIRVDLPHLGRFEAWRRAARQLASAQIPPDAIIWAAPGAEQDLFAGDCPMPPAGAIAVKASSDFLRLAGSVACHTDPQRWALLYTALLRYQTAPDFLSNPAHLLTRRLNVMAKAVGRDIHKMHAFVRFHELGSDGPRRRFAAWFEPEYLILEAGTPFFAKRFADMDWLIATPEGVANFDGHLCFSRPEHELRPDLPADASHALWQTYFANIFNPARIKIGAMRSEMPLKYWKNLPETGLISQMLADAPRRVRAMAEAGASIAPGFAAKVTARVRIPQADGPVLTLAQAQEQAASCQRCALCQSATQTVWGQGDPAAALMMVGEAPGDHEDLQGRAFVGPAGQLLRQVMAEIGLDPHAVWLTNAVKHFKFTPRGKQRLHQNPTRNEIQHCRWWLEHERRLIAPRLSIAMGASAAYALTGRPEALTGRRGQIEAALDGGPVLLTWHPSRILRLKGADAAAAHVEFSTDLARASQMISGQISLGEWPQNAVPSDRETSRSARKNLANAVT